MAHRFLTALACVLMMGPLTAAAQQAATDPFCALAPFQMLAALEGSWTLKQDAGVAVGAGLAIPLPPQRPQSFTIEYDDTIGIADLKGGSPPQSMALLPANPAAVKDVIWFMTDEQGQQLLQIGTGCDFYSLPIILGFNTYSLAQPADDEGAYTLAVKIGGGESTMCFSKNEFDAFKEKLGVPAKKMLEDGVEEGIGGGSAEADSSILFEETENINGPLWFACSGLDDVPAPKPGTMVMSLAIKFQSANFGTGILHFEGEQSGHSFFARAPVTLSR